ncbi:MAG: hypothetical protein H6667_21890 [Ardenticatenaceae bacterium]|nr:hypothetical protein [Ardenticatenaceae bacterium]MCB9444502.1 hypothetical protein [Ardenticatenaceae bacterium]
MRVVEVANLEKESYQIGLAVFLGLLIGCVGFIVDEVELAVVCTAVLVMLFGAYTQTFKRSRGLMGGMFAGGLLGLLVSVIGFPLSHNIDGVVDGALFGLLSGSVIGGTIGIITHALPDEDDSAFNRLFLLFGSIVVGAVLGAGVGLTSGAILGLISVSKSWWSIVVAALAGGIVGGYIGSYFQKTVWILTGAFALALIAALSSWINGALAGLVLGLISGTFAPMFIVALIGAYGGLFSRGVKAMVVESLEAPAEMLMQGAVPFLVPAMMVGMMVGTAASGVGGMILLPTSLAVVGFLLAVVGELEGKPDNKVSIRTIVEMTMMGADNWPLLRVIKQVTGTNRKTAVLGASVSLAAGMVGCVAGIYLGHWLAQYFTAL